MPAERVLVTGTTSGVGKALLEHYAQSGVKVISVNRRRVPELESRYPLVRFECVDVCSADGVESLLRRLADSGELPEVFILNAGINRTDNDQTFDLFTYKSVVETNLYGALSFIQPLTRLAVGGAARHVVAISSMVNYVGNPYGLGYTTSKQALTTCFTAWSRMYAGTDLVFQRVMLGPVHTAMYTMHDSFPAWMVWIKNLFSASPAATARAVARFAATRRSRLFYPWRALPLYAAMWLCRALVPGFLAGHRTRAGKARRREVRAPAWESEE
jgi:NAD(P)-dependent dehydrogenase (short-subunit alcohol dehydrogenase family)